MLLRHGVTHDVLACWFGVDRSTITRAIGGAATARRAGLHDRARSAAAHPRRGHRLHRRRWGHRDHR
ncbi:transposase family protein [Streptomyces sp. NPDC001828]|uniref:transposase family protein n=1 Tax=Streptomyces sp. NPDC001828 TaxID=3364615 RepID=UPI003692BA69